MLIIGNVVTALLFGGYGAWQKLRADTQESRADAAEAQYDLCAVSNGQLTKDLEELRANNKSLLTQGKRRLARADKELEEANKKSTADDAEIARLAAIVNKKPSTDGEVCARADNILRGLVTDSLRE